MVGILILVHAPLGQAFKAAAQHVFKSPQEHLEVIDVVPDQDPDEVVALAKSAIKLLNTGSGVLVLTDILGGTPANCTQQLDLDQVVVLAGLSLPMLLRALTYRHDTLDVVFEMAQAGAQNGAVRVDNRLRIAPH